MGQPLTVAESDGSRDLAALTSCRSDWAGLRVAVLTLGDKGFSVADLVTLADDPANAREAAVVVEVDLPGHDEANVLLFDSVNGARYRRRERAYFYGGHCTSLPARIAGPPSSQWCLIIEPGTHRKHRWPEDQDTE